MGAVLVVQAAAARDGCSFARDRSALWRDLHRRQLRRRAKGASSVRADGRGEHVIALLHEDRIDVDLPIGVHAIYKRTGES